MRKSTFILWAVLILSGSAVLRIADLHRYPPGLHYDEAADMLLSRDVALYNYRPFPVVTAYSGREALFYYIAAPLVRIFDANGGANVMATRLTSAFLGILTVAATIALGKALFRQPGIALLAAAWLAVSGPQVWLTRQGFRTSPQPLLEALALWLLWVALRRPQRWLLPAIVGGIFAGLALYVYMAARVFPLWLLLPLAVLILVDPARRGLRVRQSLVFLIALSITAIPIASFYVNNLAVFTDRLAQLAPTDKTPTLLQSVGLHLQMFFIQGDPLLRYNLAPGRPYFDPLSGLLLLIGLGVAAWQFLARNKTALERTGGAFLLFCPLLIAPSVIAVQGFPPSNMRSVAMVPLIFFLPTLGLLTLGKGVRSIPPLSPAPFPRKDGKGEKQRWIIYAVCSVLIVALGLLTWRDYEAWGGRADLFYDSDGDLNLAANWLEQVAPPNSLMYIASTYYEHPTVLAHNLDAGRIHWMMSDHLILPPADREAFYVFPRSVNSAPWIDLLNKTAPPGRVTDVPNGPDNAAAYQAFHFAPGQLPRPTPSIAFDANVSNILRLHGVDWPTATAGGTTAVTLYWEVLTAPGRDDLTPVFSLVDAWQNEIARATPYFEYSGRWLAGEWIIQRVPLAIPLGNPPGNYTLRVAWVGKVKANDYLSVLDQQGHFRGVWTEITPLAITFSPLAALPNLTNASIILPSIAALSYTPLPTSVQQGEHLRFTVNWFKTADSYAALHLTLSVQTLNGVSRTLWTGDPVHNSYSSTKWQLKEQVTDRYDVAIPPDFPAGDYRVSLAADGGLQPVFTASLQVIAVPRQFTPPPLAYPRNLRLGDAITLLGYNLQRINDHQVRLTVAWQAQAMPDQDYTVFVHLLNPDGSIFSQQDSPPSQPTSQWIKDQVIVDSYTLAAPPAEYSIMLGLYLQENGQRLTVRDATGTETGDSITIKP